MNSFTNFILIIVLIVALSTGCKNNPSSPGSERDSISYAGKIYHTVKIGDQTWLRENINIGTMIYRYENPVNNETIEKYCYNDYEPNCNKYGGLYQWNEAMAYSTARGARGICPEGWHIPTLDEFETLVITANFNSNALKSDALGFSALLAGRRDLSYEFKHFNVAGEFWCSTWDYLSTADNMWIYSGNNEVHFHQEKRTNGFSVRCIKD